MSKSVLPIRSTAQARAGVAANLGPRLRLTLVRVVLSCLILAIPVQPVSPQAAVGDLVTKEELVSSVPDSLRGELELVRAETTRLDAMRVRPTERTQRGGILDGREVFVSFHSRGELIPRMQPYYDRASVALRTDSLFKVLYVAEIDPGIGFVERVEALSPPGARFKVDMLHVRYAQTGSGGITEDLLFALDEQERLVEVPIDFGEADHLLAEGEYFCCGSFTSFDEELIEYTMYVTTAGRGAVTHRVRSQFGIEGSHRFDDETQQYVPDFRLVVVERSGREEALRP